MITRIAGRALYRRARVHHPPEIEPDIRGGISIGLVDGNGPILLGGIMIGLDPIIAPRGNGTNAVGGLTPNGGRTMSGRIGTTT
jgi:hypothetical protein